MRKYSYLDNPYKERTLHSLRSNEPLNPQLLHLVEIATKQKNENILNVMRFNDFDLGFKSRSAIDVVHGRPIGITLIAPCKHATIQIYAKF